MLRASSFLLHETNVTHYKRVIEVVEEHNDAMRGFDVPDYLDPARKQALDAAWHDLSSALLPEDGRSLTLVSKTMMGIWGCIPHELGRPCVVLEVVEAEVSRTLTTPRC